jgi:hypothetical protein
MSEAFEAARQPLQDGARYKGVARSHRSTNYTSIGNRAAALELSAWGGVADRM